MKAFSRAVFAIGLWYSASAFAYRNWGDLLNLIEMQSVDDQVRILADSLSDTRLGSPPDEAERASMNEVVEIVSEALNDACDWENRRRRRSSRRRSPPPPGLLADAGRVVGSFSRLAEAEAIATLETELGLAHLVLDHDYQKSKSLTDRALGRLSREKFPADNPLRGRALYVLAMADLEGERLRLRTFEVNGKTREERRVLEVATTRLQQAVTELEAVFAISFTPLYEFGNDRSVRSVDALIMAVRELAHYSNRLGHLDVSHRYERYYRAISNSTIPAFDGTIRLEIERHDYRELIPALTQLGRQAPLNLLWRRAHARFHDDLHTLYHDDPYVLIHDLNYLGCLALEAEDFERARAFFWESVSGAGSTLNPEDIQLDSVLGVVQTFLAEGDWPAGEELLDNLSTIVEEFPEAPEIGIRRSVLHYYRAQVSLMKKDYSRAVGEMESYLSTVPSDEKFGAFLEDARLFVDEAKYLRMGPLLLERCMDWILRPTAPSQRFGRGPRLSGLATQGIYIE